MIKTKTLCFCILLPLWPFLFDFLKEFGTGLYEEVFIKTEISKISNSLQIYLRKKETKDLTMFSLERYRAKQTNVRRTDRLRNLCLRGEKKSCLLPNDVQILFAFYIWYKSTYNCYKLRICNRVFPLTIAGSLGRKLLPRFLIKLNRQTITFQFLTLLVCVSEWLLRFARKHGSLSSDAFTGRRKNIIILLIQ